jgi:hypothetical protein
MKATLSMAGWNTRRKSSMWLSGADRKSSSKNGNVILYPVQ